MRCLYFSLPSGNFPFPAVDVPFLSQAVTGFEEKVRLYAERARQQRNYRQRIEGNVRIKVDIQTVVYVEPLGVAKAILDALTGALYRGNDDCVKKLTLSWQLAAESQVTITVGGVDDADDQLLRFTVPGTPVGKGMAFVGSPDGERADPYPSGGDLLPWLPPRPARPLMTVGNGMFFVENNNTSRTFDEPHIQIEVFNGGGDIDNTLRYYMYWLLRRGDVEQQDSIHKYTIEMINSGEDEPYQGAVIINKGLDE